LKKRYNILFFFFFCCISPKNEKLINNFEIISISKQNIVFNIDFNIELPKKLEENLKKFLYSEIKVNITIYNGRKIIGKGEIKRLIEFNKWENEYSLKDMNNNFVKKYKSLEELRKDVNKFENIEISFNEKNTSNTTILECDYLIRSIQLLPPFKFLEFYKGFGSIRKNMRFKIERN